MQPDQVAKAFSIITKRAHRILESEASQVLTAAAEQMRASKVQYDKDVRRTDVETKPWGYQIDPERPLRFVSTTVDGIRLRVDVIARVLWRGSDQEADSIDLAIRVWALEKHVAFRAELDAPLINDGFDGQRGRVMLRFHFDKANPGQPGPGYHIQLGGNAHTREMSWFHPSIAVPRIPFPPMDLVLATQLVAVNFFPGEYMRLSRDQSWISVIRASQREYWRPYYMNCWDVLEPTRDEAILLDQLWNKS